MLFAQFVILFICICVTVILLCGFASGGMQESILVHPGSDPDIDNGLKVKRWSGITWERLYRYYTHLLNLRHISRQPSTVQHSTYPNLMSSGF